MNKLLGLLVPLILIGGCAYSLKSIPTDGGKIKQLYYSGRGDILHAEFADGKILNGYDLKVMAPTIVYPDQDYSLVYVYSSSSGKLEGAVLSRKSLVDSVIKPERGNFYSKTDIIKLKDN